MGDKIKSTQSNHRHKPYYLLQIPLLIVSAGLLTVCQAPWNLDGLAWIALVPFVLACHPQSSGKPLFFIAYLISLAYWLGNLYWLIPITGPGYVCFAAFQALYWPLLALGVRASRRRNWPMVLAIPILFVGAESIQSFLFTGFSWYFLAHSQYQHLPLIQIADLFGTFGISALIAAVNGVAAEAVIAIGHRPIFSKRLWFSAALTGSLLAASLLYGNVQLKRIEANREIASHCSAASVQTNVPTVVKEETDNAKAILDNLFVLSDQCIQAGAKLIVWPETMVLTSLNPGYRDYFLDKPESEPVLFNRLIAEYAKKNQCYILVGAHGADVGVVRGELGIVDRYNSAYLYLPAGKQSHLRYDKIHLVPFGEYIPFKKSFPPLYKLFMQLSPYDYDYNLTPGEDFVLFPVTLNNVEYHFGVLICYEDTDPAISRKMVYQDNVKAADWLVNMSNDGWYVQFKDKTVVPSVELPQRTAISVFRCIENRIAILRSVNTGISCLIEPDGRLRNGFHAGTLPEQVMDRQGVEGWFLDYIPRVKNITFYTRNGDWIDKLPAGMLILTAIMILLKRQRRRIRR